VSQAVDGIGCFATLRWIALDADHAHVEGLRQLRQAAADTAQPNDQKGLTAEFVLALRQIGNHAAPNVLGLVVARFWQTPRNSENESHGMFGDGAHIYPLRARKTNPALLQIFQVELVSTRANRLDEAQPVRFFEQLVAPQAGHNDDIRFADAALEFICRTYIKAVDPDLPRQEPLLHLVSNVSKANRQLIFG